jgi:hypothetical protein
MRLVARIVLGPLLPTVFLLPLFLAISVGLVLSVIAGREASSVGSHSYAGTSSIVGLGVFLGAAIIGLAALWTAVLFDSTRPKTLKARWLIVTGLVIGLVAAGKWVSHLALSGNHYGITTWAVWMALLGGPIVLSLYYIILFGRSIYKT